MTWKIYVSSSSVRTSSSSASNTSSGKRYQSTCKDQSWQLRQQVYFHCLLQDGQRPPVSKVFQTQPQLHIQRESGRGSQSHFGQAIFSCFITNRFWKGTDKNTKYVKQMATKTQRHEAFRTIHFRNMTSARKRNILLTRKIPLYV